MTNTPPGVAACTVSDREASLDTIMRELGALSRLVRDYCHPFGAMTADWNKENLAQFKAPDRDGKQKPTRGRSKKPAIKSAVRIAVDRGRWATESERLFRCWKKRNRGRLTAIVESLRGVRVVRHSACRIGNQSRKSALSWVVELVDRVTGWVLEPEDYFERIDQIARWLLDALALDLGLLGSEAGAELSSPSIRTSPYRRSSRPRANSRLTR